MKVIFIATLAKHMRAFHIPYLKWFKEQGWEVHIAGNGDEDIKFCDKQYTIPIQNSLFKISNIKAYFELKSIIEREKYDLIHCHTPMGGLLARVCSRKCRKAGTKVLYTAHGFHFYKNAPPSNWIMYYPIEKICSYMTDGLITINKEDYELAKNKMRPKNIYYIPGVGVDTQNFAYSIVDRNKKRSELGIPSNAAMLLSVGKLIKRKNHEIIIKAVAKLNNPNVHYCIAGQGELREYLKRLIAKLGLSNNVHLLGYRSDVNKLCKSADIFCFSSKHEGLPVALMEAMASGLPCIVSNIRGNTDLIQDDKGGFLCRTKSVDEYANGIYKLIQDTNLRRKMGTYNKLVIKKFDIGVVINQMKDIYMQYNL